MTKRLAKHILVVNDTEEILDLFHQMSPHRAISLMEAMRQPTWSGRSGRTAAARQASLDKAGTALAMVREKAAGGTSAWTIGECSSR